MEEKKTKLHDCVLAIAMLCRGNILIYNSLLIEFNYSNRVAICDSSCFKSDSE